MVLEIVEAADPLAIDEGLRRRLDVVLVLEPVDLLARGQQVVLDREALAFEEVPGLQAVGQVCSGVTIR